MSIAKEEDALALMIGAGRVSDFFARVYEREALIVPHNDPKRFADLLSIDAIDARIAGHDLRAGDIDLANAANPVDREKYIGSDGLADRGVIAREYQLGSTIILQQLHEADERLAAFTRRVEDVFSCHVQTNIYLTPPSAQGFRTHYDNHDVFVLQVEGTKHWLLYDTPVELPFRRQEFDPAQFPCGPVSDEFDLEPGDMLYIPRGLMHDARTVEGQHSLHITIGALFTSWTDLLAEGLAQAGLDDAAFRRALPVGFAREGFDDADAQAHLRALLARLQSAVSLTPLLDRFADDFVQSRHPKLDGQFAQLERVKALDVDTRVGARPTVLYRLVPAGDDVSLRVYGSTLTFPARVADALRFAMEREEYTARDLPCDLDEAGRLVLLRRLVREGLVRIHD